MRRSIMEILVCPIDKHYPLELFEISTKDNHDFTYSDPVDSTLVIEGILFCTKCLRFYPIVDEIPIMLPDELREKEKDIDFLKKWRDKIPDKVIRHAKPYHL